VKFITGVFYTCIKTFYLRQVGHVFVVVCLSVCLLATLRKNFRTDLHEISKEGWQLAVKQTVKFWRRCESRIRIWIWVRIATLVRRALVEVCTVRVLLILIDITSYDRLKFT